MKFFLTALWLSLVAVGAAANDFTLLTKTLDGKNFDLSEQKNRAVIVNFWAYWCSQCREEMNVLEEIYQKYHAHGLEIIGVSIDGKNSRKKILAAAKNVSYPNSIFDEANKISFTKPEGIPVTYVFDGNLRLVASFDDDKEVPNKKDFERVLQSLLGR